MFLITDRIKAKRNRHSVSDRFTEYMPCIYKNLNNRKVLEYSGRWEQDSCNARSKESSASTFEHSGSVAKRYLKSVTSQCTL